jgi:hypothetical protein
MTWSPDAADVSFSAVAKSISLHADVELSILRKRRCLLLGALCPARQPFVGF